MIFGVTFRQLTGNTAAASKSIEKLSSGLRINRAGDDAAGLAISEKMRGQIKGLDMAAKNAQDGISFIQTAEGALNETHSILQRMRELAVQSANDTNTDADRSELQKEVDQLAEEITRIANNTEFNTKSLLNGAVSDAGEKSATFHIGANKGQNITLSIAAMDAFSLGVARDKTTVSATVNNGSGVSNVTLDEENLGTAVVNNAKITFAAADNTGNKASVTINDIDFTSAVAGDELNGKKITIVQGDTTNSTAEATTMTRDADGNFIITIGDKADNTSLVTDKASLLSEIQSAINAFDAANTTSPSGLSAALKTGATGTDTATVTGNGDLAGGSDANADQTIITIGDGTNTETITVNDTDKKVSITTGAFKGISFDVADVTALTAGTDFITVASSTDFAKKAEFAGGKKSGDAVAKAGIDISSQTAADAAITKINDAIEKVSTERSKLGAVQNRLEHTINNLNTSSENLTAAESRVRDVDMAKEMMEQTKSNILTQAAQAMLAQANQQPQGVLQLLRG